MKAHFQSLLSEQRHRKGKKCPVPETWCSAESLGRVGIPYGLGGGWFRRAHVELRPLPQQGSGQALGGATGDRDFWSTALMLDQGPDVPRGV